MNAEIVYEVMDTRKFMIAHQNFNNVKKVTTIELDLASLIKGTVAFCRP